jgi:hypothetical protein
MANKRAPDGQDAQTVLRVRVENKGTDVSRVTLEPWADYFDLMVGEELELVAEAPKLGELHLRLDNGNVTFYAWEQCILRAQRDGVDLDPSF